MIFGDPTIFAVESMITQAYERLSFRALGFFVIHVSGRRYGVCEPDATMIACSFDHIEKRIVERGEHVAPFATECDAGKIADSFRNAIYAEEPNEIFFGMTLDEFGPLFSRRLNDLMWAPDGDEAFDDGSYVLQFDVKNRVRLIAFRCKEGGLHDPNTLSDVWIPADDFYCVLQQWHDAFKSDWASMPKISG